jgi:hypothetical protein
LPGKFSSSRRFHGVAEQDLPVKLFTLWWPFTAAVAASATLFSLSPLQGVPVVSPIH